MSDTDLDKDRYTMCLRRTQFIMEILNIFMSIFREISLVSSSFYNTVLKFTLQKNIFFTKAVFVVNSSLTGCYDELTSKYVSL